MKTLSIKGHQEIREFLGRILGEGRVGHAYLFVGREGIGKRLVALEFAIKILGEASEGRVLRGTHPDLCLVEPEGGLITIDRVRGVQEWLSLSPMEGDTKVLLVDDAHALREEAANAFLKSLEEPPSSSIIVLITPFPHQLLSTIVSRCQMVRFGPLKVREVEEILKEEGLDASLARELAVLSQGSVSQAQALKEEEALVKYAKALYYGELTLSSLLRELSWRSNIPPWKRDKGRVLRVVSLLRAMLRREMAEGDLSPVLWERHRLLARLEEYLYQYNVNPLFILEYLELRWRSLAP